MLAADPSLFGYSEERSHIELKIKALTRTLEREGAGKSAVIHAVTQVLIDLCLEPDDLTATEKIGIMRHNGRALLAIVEEIDDRSDAIERNRAIGLSDTAKN